VRPAGPRTEELLAAFCASRSIACGVADIGLDLLAVFRHPGHHVVHGVALGAVDLLQGEILPLQQVGQMGLQVLRIQQLAHARTVFF
jgi:hypothetical protein